MSAEIGYLLLNGDTGLSSECMAGVALGGIPDRAEYPHDPADLNRCFLLVANAPIVRDAFPAIRALSPQWAAVIDHWDELEKLFIYEVGRDWSESDSAPLTYARMKALGL